MAYEDNRNWREYNEKLVRRGWFYLSTDFVNNWDEELLKMNKNKNGRPYRYPETFIQFCGLAYAFLHLPYRQLEGFIQALSGFVPGLLAADYSTLWQRITNLELNIPIPDAVFNKSKKSISLGLFIVVMENYSKSLMRDEI